MWLLSTDRAELKYFDGPDDKRLVDDGGYAILSHVWEEEEQSFQDLQALASRIPASFKAYDAPRSRTTSKIQSCCILAESHGYRWVWIDTCCIDKTSSSDLSEAVNSMFEWYLKAAVCYAYLSDVSSNDLGLESQFYESRWFTRGWTLQELIAPTSVLFVLSNWTMLGTRTALVEHVDNITKIGADVLLHRCELGTVSIARRMSWAARRKTTRAEDEAYCLMGIFGVNMPTIYGEGGSAFYRLQEEIMKISTDQTIFAWGARITLARLRTMMQNEYLNEVIYLCDDWHDRCLLAPSPKKFDDLADLEPISPADAVETALKSLSSSKMLRPSKKDALFTGHSNKSVNNPGTSEFTITPQGIRSILPIIRLSTSDSRLDFCIAVLACRTTRTQNAVIGLPLHPLSDLPKYHGNGTIYAANFLFDGTLVQSCRLLTLSAQDATGDIDDRRRVGQRYIGLPTFPTGRCLYGELTPWNTIDVLHRPLPHMWNKFNAELVGNLTGCFQFSKWSITELRRWGFYSKGDTPLKLDSSPSSRICVTFHAGTAVYCEAFTVNLRHTYDNKGYGAWIARVSFSVGGTTPSPGADPAPKDRGDVHIGKRQNCREIFGDTDRGVELVFNRCRWHNKNWSYYYLVDIELSGRVYTGIRDEIVKRSCSTGVNRLPTCNT